MVLSICVKNGTGGYFEEDGCNLLLKEIEIEGDYYPIPRIGETIELWEENDQKKTNSKGKILHEVHEYLVTDVRYCLIDHSNTKYCVTIYVVPIGRPAE